MTNTHDSICFPRCLRSNLLRA